ncbi:MAG: twin transmembrane helix small protein [Woeseia sp.]|nr:twin transmembrane helix small protein [Woeseiaceae bacterium]
MKFFILLMLIAIVASLGSGLYYLSRDEPGSPRVLKALKIRVALSAVLVVALLAAYFAGWMGPLPGAN